jgi:transposase
MWNRAPPYSPDLNPIEEVWAVMKKFVLKKRREQKSYKKL